MLLLGAGLLLASFRRVLQVDPGFDAERVTDGLGRRCRARATPTTTPAARFTDEALRRVRALPGVVAAAPPTRFPFGGTHSDSVILAEGYQMKPGESVISPAQVDVTPGYFEAMGAKLVDGRFFDGRGRRPDALAGRRSSTRSSRGASGPDRDPIGRRMYRPTDINDLTADQRQDGLPHRGRRRAAT